MSGLRSSVFLSADHWAQIAAAVDGEGPDQDEEAEFSWLTGVVSLERAMGAMADAAPAEAGTMLSLGEVSLEQALLKDPSMADSWLALFVLESLKPTSTAERYSAICQALAVCADRLGEQQSRFSRRLAAYYVPLLAARVSVSTPTDARLIYVGHLTARRDHTAAENWLERCDHDLSQAIAAHAYLKLHRGDYAQAAELFDLLGEDPLFHLEGCLGFGIALAGMGLWERAAAEMDLAVELSPSRRLRLEARYLKASVLSHIDPALAHQELEALYAEEPNFADVATRLGRRSGPTSFADIVAMFRLGVADEDDS